MADWMDISRTIRRGMPVYSPEERFEYLRQKRLERDGYNLSYISMGCHCGTHMDAPAHYLSNGAAIDAVSPEVLMGRVLIRTLRSESELPDFHGAKRVILRMHTLGLNQAQARDIAESGVMLLGVSGMSVAAGENEAAVHRILLSGGVWILENLNLDAVPDGEYEMVCAPLNLEGLEAAPARVFVRRAGKGIF